MTLDPKVGYTNRRQRFDTSSRNVSDIKIDNTTYIKVLDSQVRPGRIGGGTLDENIYFVLRHIRV